MDLLQNLTGTNLTYQAAAGNTVTRILGTVWVRSGAPDNDTEGVFGLHYVEADAELASAIPDPLSDTTAKWMHWRRFLVGASGSGATGSAAPFVEFELDVKAQRKMRSPADTVNFIIENDDATQSFIFALGLRVLLRR